ncbi:heparan-alpha-glucosaminide N-acetyltransferase domain-containing protein [Olivibacter sp. SA151]
MKEQKLRFTALDVFRGMTICFMIIVNSPGSGATPYWPLNHATWHGFTPTDLVFPSFLFAVGNALSFSERKFQYLSSKQVLLTIFKRAALIFLLGFLMYWFPFFKITEQHEIISFPLHETRVFGVLQRIALCYLFTALAVYYVRRKYLVWLAIALLLIYWVILLIFGTDAPYSLEGNAIFKLDLWLLGESHLYHSHGIIFDPEGLLSTIPAITNAIAGYLVGKYLQEKGGTVQSLGKLLIIGAIGVLIALVWNQVFPINKKIWSSSFALLTISLDLLILPLLVPISENDNGVPRKWTNFFIIFGKNPLFVYLLSEIVLISLFLIPLGGTSLFDYINIHLFQKLLPGPAGSLLFALCYMLFCWSVGWLLDRKKIYIKV